MMPGQGSEDYSFPVILTILGAVSRQVSGFKSLLNLETATSNLPTRAMGHVQDFEDLLLL